MAISLITWRLTPVAALDPPRPVLILDNQDHPWAAWVERRGPVTVGRVVRWDGTLWVPLGDVLNQDAQASVSSVSLALAPDGTAWVTWGECPAAGTGVGSGSLHVARWKTAWEEAAPGPARSPEAVAERSEIKVDSQGRPWVLWSEITPGSRLDNVSLAIFDKTWRLVGGALSTDLDSSSRARDLALGPGDRPFLACSRLIDRHDFQVFAGAWDGQRWVPFAGPLNLDPDVYAGFPSLVVDPKGTPTVAFLQASDGFKLVVKRWTGSTWEVLGTPGSLGARNPKLALSLGTAPVLAAVEPLVGVTVRQRSNAGWVDLGTRISTPGAFVDTLDLAVDSQGNPWVIWAEDDQQGQRIGLSRWTGNRWEPFAPLPFSAGP